MGLFDFFKKKQAELPSYDINNLKVTDLSAGFLLDYKDQTWEVVEEYVYDWGGNFFTKEFKLKSGTENLYLSVEDDDDLELTISEKISFAKLPEEVEESIRDKQRPPKKIELDRLYYRESEKPGYFKSIQDKTDFVEFIAWDYIDDTEKYTLTIEQFGENEFEASKGVVAHTSDFTNLLPGMSS